MAQTDSLAHRSPEVFVPVLGLAYSGALVLFISVFESPPTTASNPYPIIADVFGAIFLVAAYLVWRGIRWGYLIAMPLSVLFIVLFSPDIQDGLTGLPDLSTFLQVLTLLPALVLSFFYSLLGALLMWRKTGPPATKKAIPISTVFALVAAGFVIGGAVIGALGSGVESRLLTNARNAVDIVIVRGAANPSQAVSFSPDNLTVTAGTTVTWLNQDTVTHTVTSLGSNLFDSGYLPTGATFKFTFTTPGTYPYYCTFTRGCEGRSS